MTKKSEDKGLAWLIHVLIVLALAVGFSLGFVVSKYNSAQVNAVNLANLHGSEGEFFFVLPQAPAYYLKCDAPGNNSNPELCVEHDNIGVCGKCSIIHGVLKNVTEAGYSYE